MATLPFRAVRSRVTLQTGAQRVTLGGGSRQFSRASSLISLSRGSKLIAITAQENLVSVLESQIESAVVKEAPEEDEVTSIYIPYLSLSLMCLYGSVNMKF